MENCCENKEGVKCCNEMTKCCHSWKKCHLIKIVVIILLLIVSFCLGVQWGEMRSESRNFRFERSGMMNWLGYKNATNQQKAVGSVTVDVNKTTTAQ